ncbi:TIGR00659 family protein [Thalassotalea agarivorans]|uniref:TIGR00659 family protein n=2 Tax=Thalassotalea agarivorans TaxID=349064 RepID=A0A1I0AEF8_THASX|nr:TIGR00659 family protein [Thalassotalea agarivorans]
MPYVLAILLTLSVYQLMVNVQRKIGTPLVNPLLFSLAIIIPILLATNVSFEQYFKAAWPIHALLEPAIVVLGFPLYQHLKTIRYQWQSITAILALGVVVALVSSFVITMLVINQLPLAVSLSLKSITTPVALVLTEDFGGIPSITAFTIIIAGLVGALAGIPWLNYIGIKDAKTQGLAIGAASHVLGTATISQNSYEHGAYGSLSLIISASITAILSPFIVPFMITTLT